MSRPSRRVCAARARAAARGWSDRGPDLCTINGDGTSRNGDIGEIVSLSTVSWAIDDVIRVSGCQEDTKNMLQSALLPLSGDPVDGSAESRGHTATNHRCIKSIWLDGNFTSSLNI